MEEVLNPFKKIKRIVIKNQVKLREVDGILAQIRDVFENEIVNGEITEMRLDTQVHEDHNCIFRGMSYINDSGTHNDFEINFLGAHLYNSFFDPITFGLSKYGAKGNRYLKDPVVMEAMPSYLDNLVGHYENMNFDKKKTDYYNKEYREARLRVFLRDGEVCAKCGVTPGGGISLTIDHIKPVSKHPDLFLEINNMQVLCWPCNQKKSNKHSTDYRSNNV